MTSLPIALFCYIFHIPRFPLLVPRSSFPRSLVTSYCGRGNIRHKIRKVGIIPRLLFGSLFKFPCMYQQIVCTQYTAHEKQNNSNKTKLTRKRPRTIQINPFHHAVPLNSSVCFQPGVFTNKSTFSHFSLFLYLAH